SSSSTSASHGRRRRTEPRNATRGDRLVRRGVLRARSGQRPVHAVGTVRAAGVVRVNVFQPNESVSRSVFRILLIVELGFFLAWWASSPWVLVPKPWAVVGAF